MIMENNKGKIINPIGVRKNGGNKKLTNIPIKKKVKYNFMLSNFFYFNCLNSSC